MDGRKVNQTVIGLHAKVWTPDQLNNRILVGSWAATLAVLPENRGSLVSLSLRGYSDDARRALRSRLEAEGFDPIAWTEIIEDAGNLSFSAAPYQKENAAFGATYSGLWAPIIVSKSLAGVKTVLSPDGDVLIHTRSTPPRVELLPHVVKAFKLKR